MINERNPLLITSEHNERVTKMTFVQRVDQKRMKRLRRARQVKRAMRAVETTGGIAGGFALFYFFLAVMLG